MGSNFYTRFQRQIILDEFGIGSQEKLFKAKILVIGAGGLGCPAMLYLNAAGVGTIGIVDFDTVNISNLHRQILYGDDDIGKLKVLVAEEKLKSQNPNTIIKSYPVKLNTANAIDILPNYDLVIDCSDNFPTRYLVNDACVLLNLPLVYGSVYKFEGQVGVFNVTNDKSQSTANYRDLFPSPPSQNEIPNCNENGVIGVVPGIIGMMQATEAIKIITGIGKVLSNKILNYNALQNTFYEFELSSNKAVIGTAPKTISEFMEYNYQNFFFTPQLESIS